jgi:hypothetical protein
VIRRRIGWFVILLGDLVTAGAYRLADAIAGVDLWEQALVDLRRAEPPLDYPGRRDGLDLDELTRRRRFARLDRDLARRRPW